MKEIWKDVNGCNGLYQVSNEGRVKSMNYNHTNNEKILKQCTVNGGYKQVVLFYNSKRKRKMVHRLVAEAFISNPLNLPQVNHKDENKENNCVDNLEWCDCSYNINYGTRNDKISKPVLQYTKDGTLVNTFKSVREAERETKLWHCSISACCKGKLKTTGGFIWKYAGE